MIINTTGSSSSGSSGTATAGAAVAGLAGVASSIIGATSAYDTQKSANKANQKLAEYSYQKELEQWNRSNEYNTPAAQMQRLAAAGLNPNLAYGNGEVANTATSSSPQYRAPQVQVPQGYSQHVADSVASLGGILGTYLDLKQREANINNTAAMTQNYIQNSAKLSEETVTEAVRRATLSTEGSLNEARAYGQRVENSKQTALFQNSLDYAEQMLRNARAENAKMLQDIHESRSRIPLNQANTGKSLAETERINQETRNLRVDEKIKGVQLDKDTQHVQDLRNGIGENGIISDFARLASRTSDQILNLFK